MAIQQIIFFNKNQLDKDNSAAVVTASEGNAYAPFVQNRSNLYGWMTTGSVDANNTTLTCDFGGLKDLTDILLVGHNFAAFQIQYWNGLIFVDFAPAINAVAVAASVSRFTFAPVSTTQIKLTIFGTQTPNVDKKLNQLIATSLIGQLNGWPVIKSPEFNLNKRVNTMLSGKTFIGSNVGGFNCHLTVTNLRNAADLAIIETLFSYGDGFLMWLCGGNELQFSSVRQGYRLQDVLLMKCLDNYKPEWADGLYQTGFVIDMQLTESTT